MSTARTLRHRIEIIERVGQSIGIDKLCRREAWALREAGGDVSWPVQEAKIRMLEKWDPGFDDLDDDTLVASMEAWATVVTQKVLHEIKRQTLRSGVTHAPEGFSARPFAEIFPEDTNPDLVDTAILGFLGIDGRNLVQEAIAKRIDPLGPTDEVIARSHRILSQLHAAFKAKGESEGFHRLLQACEKRNPDKRITTGVRTAFLALYQGTPASVENLLKLLEPAPRKTER